MARTAAQRKSETEAWRTEIKGRHLTIENELQIKWLEVELQVYTSMSRESIEDRGMSGSMKSLKLPTFNEDKDDFAPVAPMILNFK